MTPRKGSTAADCAVPDRRAKAREMVERKCMVVVVGFFGCSSEIIEGDDTSKSVRVLHSETVKVAND